MNSYDGKTDASENTLTCPDLKLAWVVTVTPSRNQLPTPPPPSTVDPLTPFPQSCHVRRRLAVRTPAFNIEFGGKGGKASRQVKKNGWGAGSKSNIVRI